MSPSQSNAAVTDQEKSQEHQEHQEHDKHQGHGDHVARFRKLFWIMLVIAIPVVGFSAIFASTFGYPLDNSGVIGWISPVLGTIMYIFGGSPFLTGPWTNFALESQA